MRADVDASFAGALAGEGASQRTRGEAGLKGHPLFVGARP